MGTAVTFVFLLTMCILVCILLFKIYRQETDSCPFVSKEEILSKIPSVRRMKVRKYLFLVFILLFSALSFVIWNNTPTRLGSYVYIERDVSQHKQIIHANSSCVNIKKGYCVNDIGYYKYTPYVDAFCPKCVYESDAIKLSKGEK